MLETIGELARERLAASDDADAIGHGHAKWFLALAEEAEPFLKGAEQATWLQRLEDEHDNLRIGLDWFFDHGDADGAVRLAGTLWLFWYTHGHVTEARRWLRRALDVAPDEPSESLAHLLYGAGYLACEQNENEEGLALLEAGLELRRRIGDLSRIALSLSNVAEMALSEGETEKAATMFAEAAEIATAIGDKRHILFALAGLGQIAYREERWEVAGTHTRESLRLAQEVGMKRPAAEEIFWLAGIATATGDTARAVRLAAAAAFHLSLLAPHEADNPDYQE